MANALLLKSTDEAVLAQGVRLLRESRSLRFVSLNELQWKLPPAPLNIPLYSLCAENSSACPELWFKLDLDHESWAAYSKFTLLNNRQFPDDFLIQVITPEELVRYFAHSVSSFEQGMTRVRYTRICIVSASLSLPQQTATRCPIHLDS